ncbi:putative leucine-rich repeat-containing protein DDB_G0290503 [Polyergus mexicanus]|uniref:putative leucine-rich repeat-containing protein DDB_G0290503 n=1 Tax=Polyergus mexicanus TaxID=615972 RepID=UPI0038B58DDE
MYESENDWDEISLDKILTSKNDYSSAKDILQINQVASDQELSELDETKLKKSRSKRHKKKYQSTDDASTLNDENDNGAKTRKKVKKASYDKLPLKPANFQSLLKCTKTTNKSPDATKTRINVKKKTVADSQFSRSSSLTLLANYDNNDNQSSSTVHEKSLLKPVVDLTSISKIEQICSSLVEFSKDIISKINKLTSSIEDLNKRIQIVENILNTGRDKLINENSITDEIEDFIPLQTVDKFNEFDNKLNESCSSSS